MLSRPSPQPDSPSYAQVENLMEVAGDAVFRLDSSGCVLYASQRALALLGPGASPAGRPLHELAAQDDHAALAAALAQAAADRPCRVNARLAAPDAAHWMEWQIAAYPNALGQAELLAVGRDISGQRETEERLQHMATHDALTGLPNRSLLSDRIRMALAQARRTGHGFALLALDLDGFKKVNDALGHQIGDALLRMAAARLAEVLRSVDTLARMGGDEFVAVLPDTASDAEIQAIARRMIAATQMPFEIQGQALYIGTSIGAAVFPQHGDSEVALLAHAETAMYRAKEIGKARCVIYSRQQFTQPAHDVSLEAALFQAVRNGEFLLHYQPIVDAHSRQIMGVEALMRWQRAEGMVPPARFIPMAESNGLINLLGAWALKAACMQLRHFEEAAGRPLYVSVNVSPRQFRNDHFLDIVDDALRLSGLQGRQLLLEITEGILMADPERAEAFLHEMVAREVRIAIDDFGTGYSSLAYLKRFPIAALKIDRAFIKDLPASVKDAAICNVVLSLARHLNLSTVAEGVEREEQLEYLAAQGCSLIQGYLTGSPLLPEQMIDLLKADASVSSGIPVNE